MFPNQMRYQAALRSDVTPPLVNEPVFRASPGSVVGSERQQMEPKWDHGSGDSHKQSHEGSRIVLTVAALYVQGDGCYAGIDGGDVLLSIAASAGAPSHPPETIR